MYIVCNLISLLFPALHGVEGEAGGSQRSSGGENVVLGETGLAAQADSGDDEPTLP